MVFVSIETCVCVHIFLHFDSISFDSIAIAEIPQKELQRTERQANSPPADPSYDFAFRTPEYQRRENSDSLGRVRGNCLSVQINSLP